MKSSWSTAAPVLFLVLWSSGFVFLKLGLQFADPLTFLALRYAFVVVILLGPLLWIRPSFPRHARQWLHLAVVGVLLQAGYFSFTYLSLYQGMSAAGLALITSQQPILVGLLAPFIAHERVSRVGWLGLALGVIGASIVIIAKAPGAGAVSLWAAFYAILALFAITASTLWEKRFGTENHPVVANLVQYTIGFVVVLPLALMLEPMRVQWDAVGLWAALAYLVICNSIVAITLLLAMIRRGQATRVSALFFLVPPATAVIAFLLLGETIPLLAWPGILLAALGIYLVMRDRT
ncbi:MAG: DMT family transporter [Alcaligenaceae bacterium]|nr:DMT family transporter [Alcaligenaceae bacterium]